jgi:glycosyltransferase involved in cell wall biosynthesis
MRVTMASYAAVSILRGGPLTQMRKTAEYLKGEGVDVTFFDAWKPFDKGSADLVHLFGANIGTYHLAREVKRLGIPLVVSPIVYGRHSPAFIRSALSVSRMMRMVGRGVWSDYQLCADICGWAEAVLPNTAAEGELLRRGFGVPGSRVTIIPNGVDPLFANGDPDLFRKKYGLDRFILNVGHIGHERKNVLRLVRALGGIDHPSVIIGRFISGPYGESCRREAAAFPQIRLIDGLEPGSAMLASAYAACDVFVLPSLFETPGIAALEAGLAGAKLVMTPYGGTREYFEDLVRYCDPYSVTSIRREIQNALAVTANTHLRDHLRARFLWPEIARQTARAYEALTRNGGS